MINELFHRMIYRSLIWRIIHGVSRFAWRVWTICSETNWILKYGDETKGFRCRKLFLFHFWTWLWFNLQRWKPVFVFFAPRTIQLSWNTSELQKHDGIGVDLNVYIEHIPLRFRTWSTDQSLDKFSMWCDLICSTWIKIAFRVGHWDYKGSTSTTISLDHACMPNGMVTC